jgi:ornithine carbamoyltransferase
MSEEHLMGLRGRSLLKEIDLTAGEFLYLIGLGEQLRADKRAGRRAPRPARRNIALIFEKTSTRTAMVATVSGTA